MKPHTALFAFFLGIFISVSKAPAQSAAVKAYCLSVNLGPATRVIGTTSATAYFTTFDNSANVPLFDVIDGLIYVSGELLPGEAGKYYTDYGLVVGGQWVAYGTSLLTFPTKDSDQNGVPDFLQSELASDIVFTGSTSQQIPSADTDAVSGRLTRQAGSLVGTYAAVISGTSGTVAYSGDSHLLNANGVFNYDRGTSRGSLQVQVTDSDGINYTYTAEAPFTVLSANAFQFPALTFTASTRTVVSKACTLSRVGKVYIGRLDLVDGGPVTSWPDYLKWVLQIADSNDRDNNGIPDLTDVVPVKPAIAAQPVSKSIFEGQSVSFSVSATGTAPIYYQWWKNGAAIPGAQATTYSIAKANLNDAGNFTVTVSNIVGEVTSQTAVLAVNPLPSPPTITEQPASQSIYIGSTLTLSVVAKGDAPLAYQWVKDGFLIPGATGTSFTVTNVTAIYAGRYAVIVKNSVGQLTSTIVTITVSPAPKASKFLASFVAGKLFGFKIQVSPNVQYTIEASKDCKAWAAAITTSSPVDTLTWIDPTSATARDQFYRVVQR